MSGTGPEYHEDALDYTPERIMLETIDLWRNDPPDKLILVGLWEDGNRRKTSVRQSGMRYSEAMSLLEDSTSHIMRAEKAKARYSEFHVATAAPRMMS